MKTESQNFPLSPNWTFAEADRQLRSLNWEQFNPARDLGALRKLLQRFEKENGISDLHYFCSEKILSVEKRLAHRFGMQAEITGMSLSPDGNHFATGCWVKHGDYDGFGTVMIWETATGKCVNTFSMEGGVGWPDSFNLLQWSPDGAMLGIAHHTNAISVVNPFSSGGQSPTTAYVTDGWDSPPAFSWSADSRRIFVLAMLGETELGGQHFNFDSPNITEDDTRGFFILDQDSAEKEEYAELDYDEKTEFLLRIIEKKLGLEEEELYWDNTAFDDHTFFWSVNGQVYGVKDDILLHFEGATGHLKSLKNKISYFDAHGAANLCIYRDDPGAQYCVFNPDTEEIIFTFPYKLEGITHHGYHFTPCGTRLYGLSGKNCLLYNIASRAVEGQIVFPGNLASGDGDLRPHSFSPDGRRLATLIRPADAKGFPSVILWDVETRQEIKRLEISALAKGIWLSNETLTWANERHFWFQNTETGEVLSHFSNELPNGVSPADLDDSPYLNQSWRRGLQHDPDFPVLTEKKWTWGAALDTGTIYCPPEIAGVLDEELAYVLDNKWAWFFRWTRTPVINESPKEPKPESKKKKSTGDSIKMTPVGEIKDEELSLEIARVHPNVETLEVALFGPSKYKAETLFEGDEITVENLASLLGCAVLYKGEYEDDMTIAVLAMIDEGYYCFYSEEENSYGYNNYELEQIICIGRAIPK